MDSFSDETDFNLLGGRLYSALRWEDTQGRDVAFFSVLLKQVFYCYQSYMCIVKEFLKAFYKKEGLPQYPLSCSSKAITCNS